MNTSLTGTGTTGQAESGDGADTDSSPARSVEQHVAWARERALTTLDGDGEHAVDAALAQWAHDLRAHPDTADRADEVRADAVDTAVRELTGSTPAGEPQPPAELVRQGLSRFQPYPRLGSSASKREHLAACRQRALAELDADPDGHGPSAAAMSMMVDLGAHPETVSLLDRGVSGMATHGVELEMLEALAGIAGPGVLRTEAQVRQWIGTFR